MRQGVWSIGSSAMAFFGILLPTAGLSLRAGSPVIAAMVLAIWQAGLISALSSLGIPALSGTLAAREPRAIGWAVRTDLYAPVSLHVLLSASVATVAWALGVLSLPQGQDAFIGIVALSAAMAAQTSGNNVLGGRFRNDLVFLVNATAAVAIGLTVLFTPVSDPGAVVRNLGLASLIRPVMLLLLLRPGHRRLVSFVRAEVDRRQWVTAYLLALTTVAAFQRLEVGFLEARSTDDQIALFGVSYDFSQVVRGLIGSSFAVLLPIFARGVDSDIDATAERARQIAHIVILAIGVLGLGVAVGLDVTGLSDRLLAGGDVLIVGLSMGSAAALAGGAVIGTLLSAAMRFDLYLLSTLLTLAAGLSINAVLTRDAISAATSSFTSALVFLAIQVLILRRLSPAVKAGREIIFMGLAAATAFAPLVGNPLMGAVVGTSVLIGAIAAMRTDAVSVLRQLRRRNDKKGSTPWRAS